MLKLFFGPDSCTNEFIGFITIVSVLIFKGHGPKLGSKELGLLMGRC